MATSFQDISIVLSGGAGNSNPNNAIGGDPSTSVIVSGINNLFENISPDEISEGLTDYRCFYVFNDGDSTIYDIRVWIESEVDLGSTVFLGIDSKDETQRITIEGTITGGYFILQYATVTGNVTTGNILFNSDVAVWGANIASALNALIDSNSELVLGDVEVIPTPTPSGVSFEILFKNEDGSKSHSQLALAPSGNNLIGPPTPTISISVIQGGSPVNTSAPSLDVATTTPTGVFFVYPEKTSPILIPKLRPFDGFPIWVKRVTEATAEPVENDGFRFALSFIPFKI
jgi:hypothetical protein